MKNINSKNLRVVALLLVCVALLELTSCSSVFDSAISGTIKDRSARETSSPTSGGIADAMIYAYDSKEAWETAYNNWDKKSIFTDVTVPSAKSATDGSFSISSLRWKTNSPVYGKDADCCTIYLLVFHKDYGLVKVEGRTVQSDKSNNFGIVYCDKVSASKNLVIKFKDVDDNSTTATGSDTTITDTSGFSFRYSYCDGYSLDGSDNVFATVDSITNGQASITVKYKDDGSNPPVVTVYDIQTGDDWSYSGSDKVQMTYSPSSKTYTSNSLYFTNDWNTVSVTVNLKDGATSTSVSDPITFTWEYNNGEGETVKSDTVTATSGSATINVKYRKAMDPASPCTLKLTKFDDQEGGEDYWTWTESKTNAKARTNEITLTLDDDSDSPSVDVYFRKNYLRLGTGISGYIYNAAATGEGYGDKTDDGRTVSLYLYDAATSTETKIKQDVRTSQKSIATSSTSSVINHGSYSSLGANADLELTYDDTAEEVSYISNPINLKVKRDGTEVGTIELTSENTNYSDYIFTV